MHLCKVRLQCLGSHFNHTIYWVTITECQSYKNRCWEHDTISDMHLNTGSIPFTASFKGHTISGNREEERYNMENTISTSTIRKNICGTLEKHWSYLNEPIACCLERHQLKSWLRAYPWDCYRLLIQFSPASKSEESWEKSGGICFYS